MIFEGTEKKVEIAKPQEPEPVMPAVTNKKMASNSKSLKGMKDKLRAPAAQTKAKKLPKKKKIKHPQ